MARKKPDRVAAIVDLMSHMFMLAVMLFVLVAPSRPEASVRNMDRIQITIGVEQDGKLIPIALKEMPTDSSKLQMDIQLDDGTKRRSLSDGLRFLRTYYRDGRIEIKGYVGRFVPKRAVIIFNNVSTDLILRSVQITLLVRGRDGTCNETSSNTVQLGKDPVYRFALDSCEPS